MIPRRIFQTLIVPTIIAAAHTAMLVAGTLTGPDPALTVTL